MNAERRLELAASITREAALAYTAGSQRRMLDTAAWLLRALRTEDQLVPWLAAVIVELLPRNAEALDAEVARLRAEEKTRVADARRRARKDHRPARHGETGEKGRP